MCSNFKTTLRFSVLLLLCGINNTMFAYSSFIDYFETNANGGNGTMMITSSQTLNTSELLKNIAFDATLSYRNGIITVKAYNVETIPDLCKNSSFDAILSYKNEFFVLKDKWYWKLVNKDVSPGYKNALTPGYPKLISQKWPNLPDKIDTAFTDHDDKFTYFFKGSKYWKFDGEKMEKGFPRDIGVDFPGVPNDVQAVAQHFIFNDFLFFIKDDMQFTNLNNKTYYAKEQTGSWYGIPSDKLDAALYISKEKAYYFIEGNYYKVTGNAMLGDETYQVVPKVAKEDPPYPRPTASYWFGCF